MTWSIFIVIAVYEHFNPGKGRDVAEFMALLFIIDTSNKVCELLRQRK